MTSDDPKGTPGKFGWEGDDIVLVEPGQPVPGLAEQEDYSQYLDGPTVDFEKLNQEPSK